MNPKVTIVTPSYNQALFLEETILTVANQDYPNIEYMIIDGGSSDNSADIIKKYSSRLAYWVSEPDKGQADAINKGFTKSTGDLICWINSDDLLYPDFVSKRVSQFMDRPDIDMIYGDVDQGEKPGKTWLRKGKPTSPEKMLNSLDIPVPQQSAMWRRLVLEKTGMLDPQWHTLLDRDFFIRIARNHKILYIPGQHSFFRIHDSSKSISEAMRWTEELPEYYNFLTGNWLDYRKSRHKVMARCYWQCMKISIEHQNKEKSREFLLKARKEDLLSISILQFTQFLVRLKHSLNL